MDIETHVSEFYAKAKGYIFLFPLLLTVSDRSESIVLTITEDEQYYFRQVACASDSAAQIKIFSGDPKTFSNEIMKLKEFSDEHYIKAINAGLKAGRTKDKAKQFIHSQTDNSFKAYTKFIAENGFEKFHKSAISSLYAICRAGEESEHK